MAPVFLVLTLLSSVCLVVEVSVDWARTDKKVLLREAGEMFTAMT
jgi:hypothetical protein